MIRTMKTVAFAAGNAAALMGLAVLVGCDAPCELTLDCGPAWASGSGAGGAGGGNASGGSGGAAGGMGVGGGGGAPLQGLAADEIATTKSNVGAYSCAIVAGELWCWGSVPGDTGVVATPTKVIGLPPITSIKLGVDHLCAVATNNRIYCWGGNEYGQLGTGNYLSSDFPVLVTAVPAATQLAVGIFHSCALNSGLVWCWGSDQFGQLGDGTADQEASKNYPVQVVNLSGAVAMSAGYSHGTCARTSEGNVRCWGIGGTGEGHWVAGPVLAVSDVLHVSKSYDNACAAVQGSDLYCWGSDMFFVVGNGGTDTSTALRYSALSSVQHVGVGSRHACAVLADGTVRCWGQNQSGQLGNNSLNSAITPVVVQGLSGVEQVVAADDHTCAKTSVGSVYCWGNTSLGLSLTPSLVVIGE